MNKPEKIVIFDYSGTLSLEAPQFSRPENLVCALAESGLALLGVTNPKIFWEEIVFPTWIQGSTTTTGYKRVLAERIEALGLAPGATGTEIAVAASLFVDGYLDHSRIDPHWRPILENLTKNPGAVPIIATDHYAEATGTIIGYLQSWNIPAQKAGEKGGTAPGFLQKNRELSPLFIANSADIGFWKADRRFWKILKARLSLATVRSVLIIDDFGFNEEQGDRYGERDRVEARKEQTLAVLEKAFPAAVEAIPFFLKGGERDGEAMGAERIAETAQRIDRFLNPGKKRRNDS
jgi:hypothetical protein